MAQKHEFKRGFMKMQRLGPIKFTEQSRWKTRAPESNGLWAFPFPHFDLFYAYHKYKDLAPKDFRDRNPKNPKWYLTAADDKPITGELEFREAEESLFKSTSMIPGFIDENGEWQKAYLSGAYYEAQEAWIESVGRKILPLRTFWYSGLLYTHFNRDGSVGAWTMNADGEGNDWTLMHTSDLERIMRRPGSVVAAEGHRPDGKPATYRFSKDHLEVFIAPGRGVIRDKV